MKKFLILLSAIFCITANPAFAQWGNPVTWQEVTTLGFNTDNSKSPYIVYNRTNDGTGYVYGTCNSQNANGVCTDYTPGVCPGLTGAYAMSPCNFPPGIWFDVPLAQFSIPSDVKEVFLQGLLIISPSGTSNSTPDIWAQCRAPGSVFPAGNYQMQAIGQNSMDSGHAVGSRSTVSMWCPVSGGSIEIMWNHLTPGSTDDASYLVSLGLQAYAR